ncbi:uncharacterized protein LOC127123022 [Lathyrus oleraceus]|uniref:uncharacterized protein LOC127123022 n=1 Tax=Pisum sativum TaxID=3888 RepID=UPI0021D31A3E|nr:uncharacterized protein LOC127123022 [Pisum sativum]
MTLNMVPPKNILEMLKRKRLENVSNTKKIYNVRAINNKVIKGPRTKMQHLLKLLDDDHYVSRYKVCEDGVTARDILWTHNDSIKLSNIFSTVLIICSTYKTKKYKLLLLEIVGVISTDMRPPQNSSGHVTCIGLISKTHQFIQVYLKLRCPIPKTSLECTTHFTNEVEVWPDHFLERMEWFTNLSEIQRESNKKNSKEASPIERDLGDDTCFDAF